MNAVEIHDFWWRYHQGKDFVLRGIDLNIPPGSFTLVIGPNEAGKTTLMMAIKGLIPHSLSGVSKGEVLVLGEPVSKFSAPVLARRVGYVFSDPEVQFTALTVEEEILFGLENIGVPESEIPRRIDWASRVTMIEHLLDKPPYDISGGQKQRVAIASVIAMRPDILILDEPTSMIDPVGKDAVVDICRELKTATGLTIIVVEHNVEAFAGLADHVVVVVDGRIARSGSPREILSDVEYLMSIGVHPPQVTQLFWELSKRSLYSGPLPITEDEALAIGRRLLTEVA